MAKKKQQDELPVETIKEAMLRKTHETPIKASDLLSTGSTLLNLACSGKVQGGFRKGGYHFLVGDSASGKTFISLTCFAEACLNPAFKDYRLIYDNAEDGALMDIEKFFGRQVAEKIEPPGGNGKTPVYSSTVEEFYYHADDAIDAGQPFVYVLDSMDSLSSEDEQNKFQELKTAHRKGKTTSGVMTDGKAKKNSSNIRQLRNKLSKSGSILIVICQTRQNMGFGAQFNPKTRSGGESLRFYADTEIWSSVAGQLKKTVKGKERQIGITCKLQIKKNRINGRLRSIEIPIYSDYGFDDIGGCIDWLVEEKFWKESGGNLIAPEFGFDGDRGDLIAKIEAEDLERDLQNVVGIRWDEIEQALALNRKPRYG